jgi:hypothetical protein
LKESGVWDRVNKFLPFDFDASAWTAEDTEDLRLGRGKWSPAPGSAAAVAVGESVIKSPSL